MRHNLFYSLAVIFCTGLLIPATGVATPKIGVLLKDRASFSKAIEKGVMEAGAAQGVEVIVKAPPAETDISVQVQLLNALIAQGVNALVIAPDSKEALAAPVAAAAAKGIKIVVIDSPLSGKYPAFIATNQHDAGVAAGKLLSTLVTDGDDVSFLMNVQSSGASAQRQAGAAEALKEAHPKITIFSDIYASAERGKEQEKAELLLTEHPSTKAILASGTPGTMAMLKVLSARKPAGAIKLVGFGFNLNPEVAAGIENGVMQGWVAQLPKDLGIKSISTALALIKGDSVPEITYIDFLLVTKDNLQDPKVQALLAL